MDFREAGKRRVDKSRLGKKNKGSLRESNPIDTTVDIRTLVAVVGPSAPTQAAVVEPSAVYNISGVIKRTPFIGKMTVGNGPFPLFYEERHALSLFTSQVSYHILQVGQKLIAGTGWRLLCNGWRRDKGFGKYKSLGLNDGDNNWLDALRKAMKVGEMSAEVKVVEFLVDYLLKYHNMNKDEIFVKVGIIQTIKPTQQVRSFFVELIFYKSNNHY